MKIYIIGPAGSGKTTISNQISRVLTLTHTDLDDLFWDNKKDSFGIKRDVLNRNEMYEKVINQKSWIIEGAYLSWPSEAFKLADKLIYLDINKHILTFRILKRYVLRHLGIEYRNKKETLKGVLNLLKWNKKQAIQMKKLFIIEKENYPNLIRLSTKREIDNFITEITG